MRGMAGSFLGRTGAKTLPDRIRDMRRAAGSGDVRRDGGAESVGRKRSGGEEETLKAVKPASRTLNGGRKAEESGSAVGPPAERIATKKTKGEPYLFEVFSA